MSSSIKAILDRLDPVKDFVIRRPLSEQELESLKQQVGLPIPGELREYFSLVGLFQDLTWYGGSEYEVHQRVEDFTLSRKALVENFCRDGARYFPFAGNGSGDEIVVAEVDGGLKLFFADHETLEISEIGLFSEWLSTVVEVTLKRRKPANSEKKWCVQLSFKTAQPEPIIGILRQFAPAQLGEWSKEKTMPSGVVTSEAPLTFGERLLTLKKLDLRHPWGTPSFSFDFDEPATLASSESLIGRMDTTFRASDLGYKVIDYGPLALDYIDDEEEGDDETESKSAKRPWWKFWYRLKRQPRPRRWWRSLFER
jgi:hypothetical protein